MKCANCGYELRDTAKFCVNCGTRVAADNVAAAENQQQELPVKETQSIFGVGAAGFETEILPAGEDFSYGEDMPVPPEEATEILPGENNYNEALPQASADTEICNNMQTAPENRQTAPEKRAKAAPKKFRSSDKKLGSAISGIFSFLVIIAALSVGALLYITNNPEIKTGYYLDKAEGEYLAGNYEEALEVYNKVISIDSENPRSYIGIAKVYRADGDKEKAIDALYEGYRATGSESIWTMIKRYSEE